MNISRSSLVGAVLMAIGTQPGLGTITAQKELPVSSLNIVTRDEAEDAQRAVEDVFCVILPDSNVLHERFIKSDYADNRFAVALKYFAKKSRLIERVAGQEISLVALNDCIKEELRLFIKNSIRTDALSWEYWEPLLEQDLDVVVMWVIGILLKHYRNRTLYVVITDL